MSQPPEMTIDPSKRYEVTISTDRGVMVLDLDPQLAGQQFDH